MPTATATSPYGGLALGERFIREWKGRHPLITPAIGPHATNTNSAEVLKQAQAIAERFDVLLSLHTAEMDYEMETFRQERNQTPVEYLESIGLLSPHLVAAHCIHVNDQDLALMAKHGCRIAHCIGSNMKAGKGIAPLKKMVAHHIPVGLGTDGASSGNTLDLFAQLPLIGKAHKTANHDRALFPAKEILPLATIGGARVLNLDDQIGSLTPGKKADLVLVETQSANMFPIYDPILSSGLQRPCGQCGFSLDQRRSDSEAQAVVFRICAACGKIWKRRCSSSRLKHCGGARICKKA